MALKNGKLPRAQAVELLDEIREALYQISHEREASYLSFVNKVERLFEQAGIPKLETCKGEAHNPEVGGNIDHCGVCGFHGRWEITGAKIKIT